ncbi:RNA polymerase-associated protein Rtf1p [Trichomonascus vanleenenianus]|uniref:RNA polymerase-associated protein n=1 Tax=Trichomonascus vanleenenianus TaxID=2268995 RepID=UPI003EC9766A
MSDLDEDLLALAGAAEESSGEEDTVAKPSKRAKSSSKPNKRARRDEFSDDEEPSGDDDEDDFEIDADEEDEEDNEPAIKNPYPLEGKYTDEDDRDRLLALPEIERENILYERSQEMEKYRQREYLAQRAKQRKKQEEALKRKSTRARDASTTGKKSSQLSELKKRREEKQSRSKRREQGLDVGYEHESSESEEEEEAGGSEYEEGAVEWAESAPKVAKEVDITELNNLKWGRSQLSKFCHYPGFEDAISGCYVKVNMGFDRETQQEVYRVFQVKDVVMTNKPYSLLNRKVDMLLRVARGTREQQIDMNVCSDRSITDKELARWKEDLNSDHLSIPSVRKLERKYKELKEFLEHQLTSEELNEVIKKRQKYGGGITSNAVVEKASLQERRLIALESNNFDEVRAIDAKLQSIDAQLSRSKRQSQEQQDRLAKVNERNRRTNLDEIRKAEIQNNQARRRAEKEKSTADPFSRLRTSARMFYESRSNSVTPAPDSAATQQEEDEKLRDASPATITRRKMKRLDDVIAALDISLDIQV